MQGNRPTLSYLKTSKRYLQPPTLYNSGLLSSQDRTQNRAQQLHQLSNVEQKSYLSSEDHGMDEHDIRQVLADIQSRKINFQEPESPKQPRSPLCPSVQHRSSLAPRLQDQEIIAVEEQVDIDQHKGNESVILEHIDFNNQSNERQPESIRPAEMRGLESLKGNGQKYYINCVEPIQIAQENLNGSSSTPNDLSSFELNPNKVRHSKNTCIERLSSLGAENNLRITNNSCMTKPMAGQERDSINSPKSQQPQQDINLILKKWNNAAFHGAEYRGIALNKNTNQPIKKRAEYNMQLQAKYCVSQFKQKSVSGQNQDAVLKASSVRHKMGEQARQEELLIKYQDVINKLQTLEQQYQVTVQEQSRLAREVSKFELEVFQLKELCRVNQEQAEMWKDKYHQSNDNEKRAVDELRRLEVRSYELEKTIQKQNEEIRFYEEKNDKLQKQLQKTIRYNDATLLGSNSPLKKSLKLAKFDTFGQITPESQQHKLCIEKIQALQQHIFDIEQKSIGIDIQVDKRVRIIGQHIDLNLRRTIHQQYQTKIASLNDQIIRLSAQNKALQQQNIAVFEQFRSKERDLDDRENKIKKMYDELVIEWRQIGKERKQYRENSHPQNRYNHFNHVSSKQQLNDLVDDSSGLHRHKLKTHQPWLQINKRSGTQATPKKQPQTDINDLGYRLSIQNLSLRGNNYSPTSRRALTIANDIEDGLGTYTHYSFAKKNQRQGTQTQKQLGQGEQFQLFNINTKIQKLRQQINRQLDLIH